LKAGDNEHEPPLELAFASGIIEDAEALARIKMNLVLSSATPKLEAFYNYYESTHGEGLIGACESWVDWYGAVACDKDNLVRLVNEKLENMSNNSSTVYVLCSLLERMLIVMDRPSRPKLLSFDHIYPPLPQSLTRPPLTAILYGTLSSPTFRELHGYLLTLANTTNTQIEYVFRPIRGNTKRQTYGLAGYGVALDLKKMDYLAVDDRNLGTHSWFILASLTLISRR
jgi:UDP-glucose:glycoprotein glucosyltransferase